MEVEEETTNKNRTREKKIGEKIRNMNEDTRTHIKQMKLCFFVNSSDLELFCLSTATRDEGNDGGPLDFTRHGSCFLFCETHGLVDRGRVRNLISKLIKRLYSYTGYFQLYNIPFEHVDKFDYCEKSDLFLPGGMNRGENIFDHLSRASVPYHVSDWRDSEENNLQTLKKDLDATRLQ